MSELQIIEATLKRTAWRRRGQRAWRGLWQGLFVGAALGLITLGIYKLAPLPERALVGAAGVGLALAGIGFLVGWLRPLTLPETARWVDAKGHFKERLSTALEVARTPEGGEWRQLVLVDAAGRALEFDPRKSLPFRLPRLAQWTLLFLFLAAGLGFVPEYRSKRHLQQKKEAEVIREVGRELTELTQRQLDARPPALETTEKALEQVQELAQQLAKAELTRPEALRELASASDKIQEQLREMGRNPALRRLDRAARTPGGPPSASRPELQKQLEALQDELGAKTSNPEALEKMKRAVEDLQQAAAAMQQTSDAAAAEAAKAQMSQALANLAKQAEDLGLDLPNLEDAVKALEAGQIDKLLKDLQMAELDLDKLAKMAKAMKDLKLQLAEMGKDLAEQLEKGQALPALATLQKMIKQLQSANLTPEQLKQLMDEVDRAVKPGSEYGKVGEFLKQAVQQMQQNQNGEASKSLANAADEIRKLMEQMGDCQNMQACLAALKTAQMCVGNCLGWGLCKGMGRPGFKPGGMPGGGVGTWGDDSLSMDEIPNTGLWDNSGVERPDLDPRGQTDRGEGTLSEALEPTRVKGQISPGGQMPAITLKGVSIKGQSTVQYQEAVTSAQTEAQSALSQDQVPRAYRGAVRDYFDDLKE
jgi:chemotaxis protein histidine kinase CheA